VLCEDTLVGRQRRIPVDMVILSTAIEPRSDVGEVAKLFSLSRTADGFFLEKHPKLDPVATNTDGIFIAGCCQGPKDIPDTVAQAAAAAARVLSVISKGKVELEATTSIVDDKLCSGCKTCIDLCPYKAITFEEAKKIAVINEALCKGCGTCAAACPAGAIVSKHFTTEQILAQVEGVLI
jgi:heterodisulfide reductase subunit A2